MKKWIISMLLLTIPMLFVACSDSEEEATATEEVTEEENEHEEGGHHHHEIPFEWSGEVTLDEGTYSFVFQENGGEESVMVGFILDNGNIQDMVHHAIHMMDAGGEEVEAGHFHAKSEYVYEIPLNAEETTITFNVEQPGKYVLYFEHLPVEFQLEILDGDGKVITVENEEEYDGMYEHGHDHDHDHE